MKTKILFYSLLTLIFTASVFLVAMKSTKIAGVTAITYSNNYYDEFKQKSPCEGCEEPDNKEELRAEYELPYN
jgi:hypothetical protein